MERVNGVHMVAAIFVVLGGLLLVGSVGTWAKVGPFDVSGLDRVSGGLNWDAWTVLGCACIVLIASSLAFVMPHYGWHIVSGIAFVVAGWKSLDNLVQIRDTPAQGGGLLEVQVGYGVVIATIAGASGVVVFALACLNILMSPRQREG